MARPEYETVAKAMREAKTGDEMTRAWFGLRPRADGAPAEIAGSALDFYSKAKPEMMANANRLYTEIIDRGILDPKTMFLVIIACYMMNEHWEGVLPQCCNARAAGASEEEIMEVAAVMAYAKVKMNAVDTAAALQKAFASDVFKGTGRRTAEG